MNTEKLQRFLARIFPTKADDAEARLFKRTFFSLLGMVVLMGFIALAVFFIGLQGQEETMIPNLVGSDVVLAVEELNRKDLYPSIITQFTSDPKEKNTVISMDPQPGLLVKAGRRVTLRVSLGASIDKIPDYRNQKLSDVRLELRKQAAGQAVALLEIDEGGMQYQYSDTPTGTILAQTPAPGTEINQATRLVFVVSRGAKGQQIQIGDYTGKPYLQTIEDLESSGIAVSFSSRAAAGGEAPGTVILQDPAPGTMIDQEAPIRLTIAEPRGLAEDEVFGIFTANTPVYAVFVDLTLEARTLTGESRVLTTLRHPGGEVGIPYKAKKGETLVLRLYGKELETRPVR